MESSSGRRYNLPVFYFTQLLGLAMGCQADELSLSSLVVEPTALLAAKGIGR
jgi:heterodisulfide reductase subunit B